MAIKKSPAKEIKFEEALAILEEIVNKLEINDLSLDDSLQLFAEGVKMVSLCNHELNQAEEKIKILSVNNGKLIEKEFVYGDGGKESDA